MENKYSEYNYFIIQRSSEDSVPLLAQDSDCPSYFYEKEEIKEPKVMTFRLGAPIPRKPRMVDYHSSPNSIISNKIFNILKPLNIFGIQLIESIIRDKERNLEYGGYWALHIYNYIKCIDIDSSICEIDSGLMDVEKLVLDKKVLKDIPLSERLIFRLKEDFSYKLFHESIVELILSADPVGLRFIPVEEYHMGSLFE